MDGDKKKRFNRRKAQLSLTQNGESSEDNQSGAENVFHNKSSKATIKNQKTEGNVSKHDNFKSPVRKVSPEKKKEEKMREENIQKQDSSRSPIKEFCPICQVPLVFIKIPVELHTAHCLIEPDLLPTCPDGIACVSINMFHYRDFNHNELASWRCSADYIPPDYQYPAPPKSTKKRPSLSPLSLASKIKRLKTPENEKVNDSSVVADHGVRKVLFQEKPEQSGISHSVGTHKPTGTAIEIKTEPTDCESALNKTFLCSPSEKNPPLPQESSEIKPLKCDVTFEYNADEEFSETIVVGKQGACSVACLSPSNGEELQAVCTVSLKLPGGNPQIAASKSPVHVNLLLNESGWEAVQVDGSSSAKVKEVDISLCKCARAMTLKCLVADPKITGQSSNHKVQIEHKYSAILGEMGLKTKTDVPKERAGVEPSSAHEKVDGLKSKTAQLSIKSFCTGEKEEKNTGAQTKVPKSNGGLQPKSVSSSKPSGRKTPMILLAGTSASRPLTPILLGGEPPVSKVSRHKNSTIELAEPRRTWRSSSTPVPQYKRIPDTPFVVDAFKWGAIDGTRAYFLTHFHADHYMGLKKHFNQPIYCSEITANLIRLKFGVDPKFLHILQIGLPRVICNVEVEVFDANHCPGSLMFLFRLLDGRCILHVGDFRATSCMEDIRCLRQVDVLFLDTTYCDPAYDFPSQGEIVKEVVRVAKSHVQQNANTLFCCGSYTIGKEKVFLTLAEALDCKFWTNKDKAKVLKCLGDNIIAKRLVSDPSQAQLHVVYMKDLNFPHLETVLKDAGSPYTSLVAFEPTGWTTSKIGSPSTLKKTTKGHVTIYAVPYSEHSSFPELRRFVRFVRPKKIQVTVNLGKQKVYQKYFNQWLESSGGDQASLDAFLNK